MATTPATRTRRLVLVAAICALLALLPFAQARMTGSADGDGKLATVLDDLSHAVPQIEGAGAQERTGVGPHLSPEALPASVRDAMRARHVRLSASNAVQVYILLDAVTDDSLQQLKAEGVTIEIVDAAHARVQARIPVDRLRAVAALPVVNFIRPPTYAVRRAGSVTTEGDAILRSSTVRQAFGLDGTGVKVGVISDGLKGVFATTCTTCSGVSAGPIASGDLPDATGLRTFVPLPLPAKYVLNTSSGGIVGKSFSQDNDLEGLIPGCGFAGAGAEGTALLEVVHDIAPGAQLAFANADTDLAFQQAVNYLAANNDVVVDDLGFYGEAYDGTSPVSSNTAAALNNPSNRIRTYVTANGNAADEHYLGTYTDSGVDGSTISGISKSGHLHLFQQTADTTDVLGRGPQPYNLIKMPANGEVVIFLTWDDKFGASRNDYDLYVVRESNNTVVARSTSLQNGTQDPLEAVDFTNTGAADNFRIVVQNVNGAAQPKQLNLFSFQPECATSGPQLLAPNRHERHNYNTATRSVAAQNDAGGSPVSVISVGAICSASSRVAASTSESCKDPTNSTIEFFSSQGPTIDGRQKPDVAGIDGVSVTGAGSFVNPFFGTSAAAPHIAGIAALLLQSAPCLVSGASGAVDTVTARANLRDLIVSNAVPLGGTPDNVFGAGRADALNSVQKTLPVFSGSPTVTVPGNAANGGTITASQIGFRDPNGCALTRLSASGACSASGTSITCPFGASTPAVSASNNGVAFSPATNVQVVVTNFSVGAAPGSATVTAGQSAVYQAVVSAQGGPFSLPVTLGCDGLPSQASCSFNPSTVTPGAGAITSTLTISTTARPVGQSRRGVVRGGTAPPWTTPPRIFFLGAVAVMGGWLLRTLRRGRPGLGAAWMAPLRRPAAITWPAVALMALTAGPAFNQMSCGGNSSTPAAPAVTLSPASLTFTGQNLQTTSAAQNVTLTNSGKATLSISGIAATGDFSQTNTCGGTLAAGANCSIAVKFTPTAAGQRAGSITISDNAANSPHSVALSGTGIANGTPAGTYQVRITGSAGSNVQAGTVTLVVQ